jgi:hypothetical protein
MWNIGSTNNLTFINQGNMQIALNLAINSPGAVQNIGQFATNNVIVFQQG